MNNGKSVGGLVMIVIGGVFLFLAVALGGGFFAVGTVIGEEADNVQERFDDFKKHAEKTSGKIVDTSGGTTVSYEVDGDDYLVHLDATNSAYPEGKKVTVYYDEDDPSECMVPDFMIDTYALLSKIFLIVSGVSGGLLGVVGLVLLILGIILRKKPKEPENAYRF